MLKIALYLRAPINAACILQDLDKSVKNLNLFDSDWETIEQLANCFQIFASTTVKMQAETCPTLNWVIVKYLKIMSQLQDQTITYGGHSPIGIACKKAYDKLKEYWTEMLNHPHTAIATILDPRFNLEIFSKLNIESKIVTKFKAHFEHTFLQYQKRAKDLQNTAEIEQETQEVDEELASHSDDDLFDTTATTGFALEYSKYYKEPRPGRGTDIMAWWKAKQWDYPILAEMARDFLAIVASSSPSERLFSIDGDLITKKRNGLSGRRIRQILYLHAQGIVEIEEEDSNEGDDEANNSDDDDDDDELLEQYQII